MRSYRPEELFDDDGRPLPEVVALAPAGERRMGANPHANGGLLLRDLRLPDFRDYAVDVPAPGRHVRARRRACSAAGCATSRPPTRTRSACSARTRRPPTGSARCSRSPTAPGWPRSLPTDEHLSPGRPRDGGAQRAPLPGLARGLPADRPPRPVQLLRGLHPHRRLDVQPAREVAEGHAPHPVAAPDRLAELPAELARLAPGPQRLLAPGPGLHRPRRQQEGRDHPRLPAAGRQLPAVGDRPLPAQPPLRQRDRGRQAAVARLPDDGRGDRALHARDRHLGLGVQRRRRRAGRRARLRRRHPDARDGRRRGAAARAPARAEGARGQRRRPDAPAGRVRAPARALRQPVRRAVHQSTSR